MNQNPQTSPIHPSTKKYITSPAIAKNYDSIFTNSRLFRFDSQMLDKWFAIPCRMIDLGCGTGRHLVQFARKSFDVTGIDLSAHMLDLANPKLTQSNLTATLIQADFCNLTLAPADTDQPLAQHRYDAAICMFSTLGLIQGQSNRLTFLKTVHSLLKPNAKLALHVHNYHYNIWRHEGRTFMLKNWILTKRRRQEPGDKIMSNYRGIKNMYIHTFTETEIRTLLTDAGFNILELISLNGNRTGPVKGRFLARYRTNGFLILAKTV